MSSPVSLRLHARLDAPPNNSHYTTSVDSRLVRASSTVGGKDDVSKVMWHFLMHIWLARKEMSCSE